MSNLKYHAFKKPKKLKNGKRVYRWYYYWLDETGKQHQKSCGTKVKSRQDAEDFIRTLPPPKTAPLPAAPVMSGGIFSVPTKTQSNPDLTVREIAEYMYIPDSPHIKRRKQLKKSTSAETMEEKRRFVTYIIKVWGDRMLRTLELDEIMNYLFAVERSGSWKNAYISALNEIYQEGQFLGCKIFKPSFPAIGRDYNKPDAFTESEIERFFKPGHFTHDFYLFFLTTLSGGLRLGEARGLRAKQILFDIKAVVVDGFMKKDNKTRVLHNKRGTAEHPKLRVVPYPDFTLELLSNHLKRNNITGEDYVFTHDGNAISTSMAERGFIVALINAGIAWDKETLKKKGYWKGGHVKVKRDLIPSKDGIRRRLVPHSLRYTYITRMSRHLDPLELLKLTGHDSKEMVDYYNRRNLEIILASVPNAAVATSALLPQAIRA